MRMLILLSATILSGAISTSVFAHQYTCAPAIWDTPKAADDIYTFVMTSRCTLTADHALNVVTMKDAFERHFQTSPDFRVLAKSSIAPINSMSGNLLTVAEARQTAHGMLRIEGKVSLMDNGKNIFVHNYISDCVNGEDRAKYTKYEQLIIEVSPLPTANTYQVVFTQTNKVEKPWYAPKGKFQEKAQEGIEEGLEVSKKGHMKVVVGAI